MSNESKIGAKRIETRGHVGIGANAFIHGERPMVQQRKYTRMEGISTHEIAVGDKPNELRWTNGKCVVHDIDDLETS